MDEIAGRWYDDKGIGFHFTFHTDGTYKHLDAITKMDTTGKYTAERGILTIDPLLSPPIVYHYCVAGDCLLILAQGANPVRFLRG
jgi:hypothetical protein